MGLRDFNKWNITLCLRLLWILFENGSSLWAELIKSNRMRDDNLWSCDAEKSKSWAWQSLLQLRPLDLCFIHAKVGDGRMISFWWDVWTLFDQLIEHI